MLSERDERINNVMTELAEVHEQLRCQESSLQIAYNHLADASRDKARVRQQLIENQAELTGVSILSRPVWLYLGHKLLVGSIKLASLLMVLWWDNPFA